LLFVFLGTLSRGEIIPMWDGKELDAKVIVSGPDSLIVETTRGGKRVTLHWDQVSRKFRLHPLHGQPSTPDLSAPATKEDGTEDDGAPGIGDIAPPGSPNRFTILLVVVFVLFWSNLWALRVVDTVGPQDRMAPYRNLLALFFGIPVALFYRLKRRGAGGPLFESDGGASPAVAAGPSCQFYTWENEPLKPGRKSSSGLHVAQEVFARALASKASDVHFNTGSEGVKVAMRVDGVLRPPEVLAGDSGRKVMAAIKMAAGMDVARRHETQDGACRLLRGEQWFDLRIARAWAVEGEALVVRILRAGGEASDLTDFGMSQTMAERAADLTKDTSGIIVLAGPTGSGKTTTIYSMLRLIEGTGRNILTIEDPVEHRLQNATQISLNPKVGGTFANALRASMRHDPDVILVGEVRDAETMNVAFQAALTGHLVFTTLHATGLMAVIGRLHELGLSAYMIKTGLQAVICQRLVRKLCPSCRQAYLPDEDEQRFWGLKPEENPGLLFYKPQGCHLCENSGYHGRTGVFRMVTMDNEVRAQVQGEIQVEALSKAIEATALGTVPEYARRFLAEGVTSTEELRRTLGMFDFGRAGAEEQP
jgi:type II secretory ATPase GspE/PulE/Tfp pilus assembly ATPase PilB-like protein